MFPELIAFLFMSRDFGHRAHLRTNSNSQHNALAIFYTELTQQIDVLVEAYQGRYGVIDIPTVECANNPSLIDEIASHLKMVEGVRHEAIAAGDSALQSLVDDIVVTYLRTLYRLRVLA